MTSLLIIDPQNDFCIPGSSLFVNGADADMHRLSKFIIDNAKKIDSIHLSLDMHMFDDIAHPMYWVDKNGNNPEPFTNITYEDWVNGVWRVSNDKDFDNAANYLAALKAKNNFTHTIWPYHCIAGTYGANIFPTLYAALKQWMEVSKKSFSTHIKGMDRNSEHFGIFQSELGTDKFNYTLLDELFKNDSILVAGQAKSHCVATSLKQMLSKIHMYEHEKSTMNKVTLLTDTTSNVSGCEHIADEIYSNLQVAGMKESTTEDIFKEAVI